MRKKVANLALPLVLLSLLMDAEAQEVPLVSDLIAPFVKEGKFSADK